MKRSAFFPAKELAVILSVIFLYYSAGANTYASNEDGAAISSGTGAVGVIDHAVYTPILSSAKQIIQFRFNNLDPDAIGLIDQVAGTVTIHVPFSQSLNGLVASFTLSPLAHAYVGGVLQSSGLTANDFINSVTYMVIAEDGSTRNYFVHIVRDQARTGKVLESFSFQGLTSPVQGVIDQVSHTITVNVPFSTNVTSLIATFTKSYLATVKIGSTVQLSGLTPNNFSGSLLYSVYAEDASVHTYLVTVSKDPISSAKQITDFRFNGLSTDAIGTITEGTGTIVVTIPWAADINNLVASFSNSLGSAVKVGTEVQVSGVTHRNFSSPVTYTVTAENGTTKNYTINVSRAAVAIGNTILTFNFEIQFDPDIPGTIDQVTKTINLMVPFTQNVTGLVPSFTFSRSSTVLVDSTVQISAITPNDFTNPLIYFCRAEDGSTELYTVTVSHLAVSNSKQLLDFRFNLLDYSVVGVIDQANKTVNIHVPFGTDISYLVGFFTISPLAKAEVENLRQVSGETPQNFSHPVAYHIIAENNSEAIYTVTVLFDPNREKRLYTFKFNSLVPPVTGVINEEAKTVQVNVLYSTSRSNLIASFTQSTNATVWIGSTQQVSGVTVNNFTDPKAYVIKAQDNSTQIYTVSVLNDPQSSEAKITDFRFIGLTSPAIGVIDEAAGTIRVAIPFAASYTNLVASFTNSAFSTVKIGSVLQLSGTTPNNFTTPLTYLVTAENGTTRNYVVTVFKAPPSTANSILSLNFEVQFEPDIIGTIDQVAKTIRLIVPFAQDVTALIPTFTSSPFSRVLVGSTYQVSGITANNFTIPAAYKCEAEDGSIAVYTVTLLRAPASSLKDILTFRCNGLLTEAIGVIDPTDRTIIVNVPGETIVTNLVCVFTLSPLAIAKVGGATQISGVTPNDFTNPVQYTIVAEDNSEQIYTVRIVVGPYVDKKILTFGLYGLPAPAEGTIDESVKMILVYVPFSTSRANLVATFSSSARSTVWIGDIQQVSGLTANDFNSVRTYTVKAEDHSTQDYQVMVLKSPALTGNQILSFSFNSLAPPFECIIDQAASTITAELPFGTSVTELVATFTNSLFASVSVVGIAQVSGFTPNDFSQPIIYRCTSESGLINEYVVTVNITQGSAEKEITYFAFEDLNPVCVGIINQLDKSIILEVTYGTLVSSLRATFINSPKSTVLLEGIVTQISGINYNDFTLPVIYRVVAEDGTTVDYTITVNVISDIFPPIVTNPVQMVTNAAGQYVVLESNETPGKVYIIKSDAPQTSLTDLDQSVSAGLGRSAIVTQSNTEIRISTYTMEQGIYYTYAIDGAGNKSVKGINSISIIDRLAPDVFMQGQIISNASANFINIRSSDNSGFVYLILEGIPRSTKQQLDAAVGALKGQKSVVTFANIDIPVSTHQLLPGNYRAFAVDNNGNLSTESAATVVITQASHLNSILGFSFNGLTPQAIGQIVGTDIFIRVQVGTPLTALVASYILSPLAKAYVGLVEQNNEVTPNNFTNPVVYTIEAEDGSTMEYQVTVSFASAIGDQAWFNSTKAFPNPVADRLTLEMTQPADRIQIVNALGQTVSDLREPGRNVVVIETDAWMKGIYFIRYFREEKCVGVQKIIRN
ncbi:MAG: hypothetical protein D4R64_10085 [Porphyromonadaceae bacterium]|nr:MAG: hypothetical protein D4R64_10085 [Porphyromonadaceae bacterium]